MYFNNHRQLDENTQRFTANSYNNGQNSENTSAMHLSFIFNDKVDIN